MHRLVLLLLTVGLFGCGTSEAQQPLPETNYYAIDTPMGRMVVRLFDETPLHRDNFKRLVQEQFYDSTRFHRIMAGFMIQGGDPLSKNADPYDDGQGDPGYTIQSEILPDRYHTRGALAAARKGDMVNPERRSSGSQFYLVTGGGQLPDSTLLLRMRDAVREATQNPSFTWPDSIAQRYRTEGGAPFLDGQYTIFGELVEGFAVLDSIASVETGRRRGEPSPLMDQPPTPISMTVRALEGYTPPADSLR